LATFDARAFNIPKEEVTNYFIWRQQDATKNSISMLAQSLYPHSELQGKSGPQLQELCWQKKVNWNDIPTSCKRGTACYRTGVMKDLTNKISYEKLRASQPKENICWVDTEGLGEDKVYKKWGVYTHQFIIDEETPIFSQDRTLIEVSL
jgi:tRNA(His) 5'-end guanylyltransferase